MPIFGRRKTPAPPRPDQPLVFEPLTTEDLLARAEAGNVDAMTTLAGHYYEGRGVAKDPSRGAYWLQKAEAAGDDHSTFMLAAMYAAGNGVPRDGQEAMRRFRSYSTRNSAALHFMSKLYFAGDIYPQNVVLAYVCCRIAAAFGSAEAIADLTIIAANISPAQLEQGDALFHSWMPGTPPPEHTTGDVAAPADLQQTKRQFFATFMQALSDLKPSDLGVLEVASSTPDANIMTVAHSPLAVFATLMERAGWVLPQKVPDGPASLNGLARQYRVTANGVIGLKALFQALLQMRRAS